MVILTKSFGQRSNNLFQHIHIDSFCRDKGILFINPFLKKMYPDYPELRRKTLLRILSFATRILLKTGFFDLFRKEQFNTDVPENKDVILKGSFVLVEGWLFRSFETTTSYRKFYQTIFQPDQNIEHLTDKYLKKSTIEDVNLAVHIRRGDYESFEGGRFLFGNDVYSEKIKQFAKYFRTGLCRIVIFSNDRTINASDFGEHAEMIVVSRESEIADHYLMSECDYILGPPSTFSLWASYIGEVPCYQIKSADDVVSPEKFSICTG